MFKNVFFAEIARSQKKKKRNVRTNCLLSTMVADVVVYFLWFLVYSAIGFFCFPCGNIQLHLYVHPNAGRQRYWAVGGRGNVVDYCGTTAAAVFVAVALVKLKAKLLGIKPNVAFVVGVLAVVVSCNVGKRAKYCIC